MRGLLMVLALLVVAPMGWAESLLAVSPLRVELTDGKPTEVLSLTNRSSKQRTYKVTMQDQVMNWEGVAIQQDDFPYSAKRMLRFMPRVITLDPGQRQNVRVMATLPEGTAEGEYHTHLIFDEVVQEAKPEIEAPKQGFAVQMDNLFSIGLPVLVQHGKVESALKLVGASYGKFPNGKPEVKVMLERSGNGEASGVIQVQDDKGNNIASTRTMHVYREADKVAVSFPINQEFWGIDGKNLVVLMDQEGKPGQRVDVTP